MTPAPQPGWYTDPTGTRRYWNGSQWQGPDNPPAALPPRPRNAAASVGVLVLSAIGLVISLQSTSLLAGSGVIWTGVVVAGAGTAAAFFLPAHTWVRVVAMLMLGVALMNAVSIEHQMSVRRDQIKNSLDRVAH